MIAHKYSGCPTQDALLALLEPFCRESSELDDHLDECPSCRERLCALAGEASWWQRASDSLSSDKPRPVFAASICALSAVGALPTKELPLQEHELQHMRHMLEPPSHPELIGRIGRYELEQLVGRGGMGLVFRARDMELHRVVAVKTLAVHLIPNAAARDRFVREARATASLTHPHIVPVYDVITQGAVPAIVMRYVAGLTLEQKLQQVGRLPWNDVMGIAIQLSDALAVAHERGLVHRDIKPGNVLLEADGSRALLTDFGLVRALDDATLTRSGVLAGTPEYMSPEQARGDTLTPSSDLFSLGSMLYRMLAGHLPFRADNPMAILNRICHEHQRSLAEGCPDVPLEFIAVVERLLAKQPRRRFDSAEKLAVSLRGLASSPRRLKAPLPRWLRILAGAVLAMGIIVVLAFAWGFWKPASPATLSGSSLQAAQAQTQGESAAAQAFGSGARLADQDLAEMQQLDTSIQQLQLDLRELMQNNWIPPTGHPDDDLGTLQPTDVLLNELKQATSRLEHEMQPSFAR